MGEKCGGAVEAGELEALVEMGDRDGMNRFESNRDLESSRQECRELECQWSDHVGVRFNGHGREPSRELRDARQILGRHGPAIEKVARVVELQSCGKRRLNFLQRSSELDRQRASGCGTVECVAPKITERTGEGTLGAGEKDGDRALDTARGRALLFYQRAVGCPRIDEGFRRPQRPDPRVRRGARGNGGDSAPRRR